MILSIETMPIISVLHTSIGKFISLSHSLHASIQIAGTDADTDTCNSQDQAERASSKLPDHHYEGAQMSLELRLRMGCGLHAAAKCAFLLVFALFAARGCILGGYPQHTVHGK